MSTIRRKRLAATVLTVAATLGLAFAGASSASADPGAPVANANQYAVFYAPTNQQNGHLTISGEFKTARPLSTQNITVAATCGTNVYTAAMNNTTPYDTWDRYAVWLPASEAGHRCYVWGWSTNSAQTVVFEQPRLVDGSLVSDPTVVTRSSTGGL